MPLLAYFISYRTYGTWLHGHPQGSVDQAHNVRGTPFLPPNVQREMAEFRRLRQGPVTLDHFRRYVVDTTVREVCAHRSWRMHALNVRSTHVHIVVAAPGHAPERVMSDLKAWSTRRLVEAGVVHGQTKVWSEHGSTRYVNHPEGFAEAMRYVLEEQGEPLLMVCPPGWSHRSGPDEREDEPAA